MTNQLTKPQILTDEQIAAIMLSSEEYGWGRGKDVAEAQRDDTLRETLKMVALKLHEVHSINEESGKVGKLKYYTLRVEEWQALNQLAGGK